MMMMMMIRKTYLYDMLTEQASERLSGAVTYCMIDRWTGR